MERRFFDSYPRFYQTSMVGATPNRLNHRHWALIEANKSIIFGRSILDIGSHDGRWSFAAFKAGAHRVFGIEARVHLVETARATMQEYQVPEQRVCFIAGDVYSEITRIAPGSVDTVFCFGFFYHTMHHMLLLSHIVTLRPRHLVMDSMVSRSEDAVIEIREEDPALDANAVGGTRAAEKVLVGYPSQAALECMLRNCGFRLQYYEWHKAGIGDWEHLEDYRDNERVSLAATRELEGAR